MKSSPLLVPSVSQRVLHHTYQWVDIPLEKVTPLAVQHCDTTEKKFQYNVKNQALRDFLSRLSEKGVIIYQRGLLSFLLRQNTSSYSTDELNNYLQKDI